MGIYWTKNIFLGVQRRPRKGGATMQASLCLVYNSNPILSKNSQPPQGSRRVDTWRRWVQQSLHTNYNCPVRFLCVNTLWLNTWWVSEKGKGGKSFVAGNGNLRKGHIIESVGTPNLVTGRTSNKEWRWREHGECLNNIAGRFILRVTGKVSGCHASMACFSQLC